MARGSSQRDHVQILAALETVSSNSDALTAEEFAVLEDRRQKITKIVFEEAINASDRVIDRRP